MTVCAYVMSMSKAFMDFTLHPQLVKDCTLIGDFPLCRVLLAPEKRFAWFILVPKRADIRESYQLTEQDQLTLMRESALFGQAIMSAFDGDKLNIGALGNMVPQLHVHHIVRHKGDAAWPGAVWGYPGAKPYSDADLDVIKDQVAAMNLPDFIPAPRH